MANTNMLHPRLGFVLLAGCLILTQITNAADKISQGTLIATSGSEHVQLVELYSSESCSSCPPADQWISELKDKSDLWKKFVPVVLHVDYWNNLGWVDKYSSQMMTQRQMDLARSWAIPNVYTPAMVVDGKEWTGWRNSYNHLLPSLNSGHGIILSIYKETDGSFSVKTEGLSSSGHYNLRVAILGMDLSTQVKAGENSGRRLTHNFIVLDWLSKSIDTKKFQENFKFKNDTNKSKIAIAAWIEEDKSPVPLQAVGGYL